MATINEVIATAEALYLEDMKNEGFQDNEETTDLAYRMSWLTIGARAILRSTEPGDTLPQLSLSCPPAYMTYIAAWVQDIWGKVAELNAALHPVEEEE